MAAPVAAALIFTRQAATIFGTVKSTAVVLCALAILLGAAGAVARRGVVRLPWHPAVAALAVFVGLYALAVALSGRPLLGLVGVDGRHIGLGIYLAGGVLCCAAMVALQGRRARWLVAGLVLTAVPLTVYGLAQAAGWELVDWVAVEGGPQVFATLGNANFYSAWLGIVAPLAVVVAATARSPRWLRLGAGLLAAGMLAAAALTDSLQGLAAAAVGLAVLAAVWVTDPRGDRRVRRRIGAVGLGAAGLAAGLLAAGVGPLGTVRAMAIDSLGTRLPKWQAAWSMLTDAPLAGRGPVGYAAWFRAHRPPWLAAEHVLERGSDSAHNVVLDLAVTGGAPLALAFVALSAVVAWTLVTGLRGRAGADRLLLGGLGAAWAAYHTQALVSMDVPRLLVLHWVLAGAIVALAAAPALRSWAVPGLAPPAPAPRSGKQRRRRAPRTPPRTVWLRRAALATVGLVGAGALWAVLAPLRADLAAGQARMAVAAEAPAAAAAHQERAAALAPWSAGAARDLAAIRATAEELDGAVAAYRTALERFRRDFVATINLARLAVQRDAHEEARGWYARALELDPHAPALLAEAAENLMVLGAEADARPLLEQAVQAREDEPEWWLDLAELRRAAGEDAAAAAAARRALALDPGNERARTVLADLDA